MPSRQPPPEAKLIAAARRAIVPSMSMAKAAQKAGISPTRWRQLEHGMIRVRGKDYPERAPAETLALMALAVGVAPGDLQAAGRGDAAEVMAALARSQAANPVDEAVRAIGEIEWLSPEDKVALIREYRQRHRPHRAAG